ncbi:hypothetical protein EX30DRAFT_396688 [Ascodesmis nigricans]|uniref:Uncharacterized protein n=1 Tax=Ascodesmis nigricans TaxID=341454 RepID=A0A4S2MTN5_9PEZI|nr:hypothetical protein EX30DRAFT_396688 [Ascodesmis nigricans]
MWPVSDLSTSIPRHHTSTPLTVPRRFTTRSLLPIPGITTIKTSSLETNLFFGRKMRFYYILPLASVAIAAAVAGETHQPHSNGIEQRQSLGVNGTTTDTANTGNGAPLKLTFLVKDGPSYVYSTVADPDGGERFTHEADMKKCIELKEGAKDKVESAMVLAGTCNLFPQAACQGTKTELAPGAGSKKTFSMGPDKNVASFQCT